jgi:nitric oxide reductase subunit B
MALFAIAMYRKGEKRHPNQLALNWTLGTAIMSFVGAGLLGVAHTLPAVNLYTHGTFVTAMHGHMAFWGAYGMLVLAIITYAMPLMTGRKLYTAPAGNYAFWLSNIGMVGMVTAFAAAGVTQVYLERKVGMEFIDSQQAMAVHFLVLIGAATLFTVGVVMFVVNFFKYGRPTDEALERA